MPAVEQRIGSSSQPLEGAGFDPAFIPGLTSPVSGEPADAKPQEAEEAEVAEEATPAESEASESEEPAVEEPAVKEPAGKEPSAEEPEEADEEETPDGPVFEASDRRAKIVADHKGVRLTLDDQQCEFRWDEIGAVETEAPRFGKRFTITVHTPDRRWYPIEIEATARARFQEWDEQLDAVLDAYFEDGDEDNEGDGDDAA
ncbi:hypothetical protein ADK57_34310 [Streptomyces sp. MMG1533]|nr:hypothetical protein ADK57_34310 [Streptomyces sp. MMG1533]